MKLLWRQLPSSRSLYNNFTCRRYTSSVSAAVDPLRILFCGSDEFSIASLRALHAHHKQQPHSVASINVVHRPGKRTGRGLKTKRQVPIKKVAEELRLPIYEIDTFTGWEPHTPVDLVVAVSFGLLVPPRILNYAQYGGLNVHPSLLPDLRGPAPIHHTLLKQRPRTGITVQTLHPQHFDQGLILAQTPYPGLSVPGGNKCTPSQLLDFLAPIGAEMLVDVIKTGAFVPPLRPAGWYPDRDSDPIAHAEKITKKHRRINWATSDLDDILLRHRVLGDLWCVVPFHTVRDGKKVSVKKRVVIHQLEEHSPKHGLAHYGGQGFFVEDVPAHKWANAELLAMTCDFKELKRNDRNVVLKILSCTVDGGKKGQGRMEILNSLKAR